MTATRRAAPGLRHWLASLSDAGGTDAELLDRFRRHGDPAAVEALIRRHGPMVSGVCRRVLGGGPDADAAFQATFLVFVRKARSVRPGGVGNWLYGVARRTALKAKAMNRRWTEKRHREPTRTAPPPEPDRDSVAVLDEELAALPVGYRAALVLCELEGKSVKEAARHLGVPPGTVASRLARGRALLAERLRGRGVALSVAAGLVPVEAALLAATQQAACRVAAGRPLSAAASASVASLTQQVLRDMLLTKLKLASAALLALGPLAVAAVLTAAPVRVAPTAAAAGDEPPAPAKKDAPARKDPAQDWLDSLDRGLSGSLVGLVKAERAAGKPVTSPALVREVARALPGDDALARLVKDLETEKAGKDEAAPAVRDLLAEYHRRYTHAPTHAEASITREQFQTFSDRTGLLTRLGTRFGGHDRAGWDAARQAEVIAALEQINDHRRRAGLKALPVGRHADLLALRHAVYLDLNRDGDRFRDDQPADDELPGRPGFTYNGRLLAASTLVGFGKPADVVAGWMATLPGRCALLRPDLAEVRMAQVVSVPAGPGFRGPLVVARYSNVKDVVADQKVVVAVPADGATDVPPRMLDQRPSLVPAGAKRDPRGRAEVGYPVSVTFWGSDRIAGATATLSRRAGDRWETVPAYLSTPDRPALPDVWLCNLATVCLIPEAPLAPGAEYRAEFKAAIDGKPFEKTLTFRTAKAATTTDSPAMKYEPAMSNSLNNAFRFRPGLLLGNERSVTVAGDEKYLVALDAAFYRLVYWRAKWERTEGDAGPWRPLMELARDWAPGRKELAEMLPKVAAVDKSFPAEGLDLVADHATRYRELAAQADASKAVRDAARHRLDALLSFYRKSGGRDPAEIEAKVRDMAERAVVALNEHRQRLSLPPVALDARLSRACRNHAVYIDLNRGEGPASWTFWGRPTPHEAERGRPGYSEAGAFAGMSSDIAFSTPERCVNGWMSSFFHRIPLLSPEAKEVGVGFTYSADAFAVGTGKVALLSVPALARKVRTPTAVLVPAAGATGVIRNYGLESPNPIGNPEKKDEKGWPVAGFPVTATFFGSEKITEATGKLFRKAGDQWEEVPAYFSSPENPAAYFPDNLKTLCLMAKDWLAPETTYKAEFTAVLDGRPWRGETTFTTGGARALVDDK